MRETFRYPARIPAWIKLDADEEQEGGDVEGGEGVVDLETKRRRWGRFVGLRGCETPTEEGGQQQQHQEMEERMEREWRRALDRARDEERLRDKGWRGRW